MKTWVSVIKNWVTILRCKAPSLPGFLFLFFRICQSGSIGWTFQVQPITHHCYIIAKPKEESLDGLKGLEWLFNGDSCFIIIVTLLQYALSQLKCYWFETFNKPFQKNGKNKDFHVYKFWSGAYHGLHMLQVFYR